MNFTPANIIEIRHGQCEENDKGSSSSESFDIDSEEMRELNNDY